MKRALFYSIATASLAGLLTGGVMKLGPNALSEMGGPQILISGDSARSLNDNPGGATFTGYNGEFPGYVLGSDWAQPPEYPLAEADGAYYEPLPAEPEPQAEDAVFVAPVKISSPPPPEPVSYPSVDGDILGGVHDGPDAFTEVVAAQQDPDSLPS